MMKSSKPVSEKIVVPHKQETDFDVKQNTQIKDSAAVRDKPISLKSMSLYYIFHKGTSF